MTKPFPKVSIIIACYNNGSTIKATLESALEQDYSNFEIIVNDDCSSDNTVEQVGKFLSDKRIKFSSNRENLGVYGNFDKCIRELATGEYFTMVNGDDIFINKFFISEAVKLVSAYPSLKFVKGASFHAQGNTGKFHLYDNWPAKIESKEFFKRFKGDIDFGFVGIFFERNIFNSFNFFDIFKFYGMDYFINFIMTTQGGVGFIKTPSYQFNVHENNSNYKAFQPEQIECFFNEFRSVISNYLRPKIDDKQVLDNFNQKFSSKFVQSVIEFYFKFKRSEYQAIIQLLSAHEPILTQQYISGVRWKVYKILFRNVNLGTWVMHKNWQFKNTMNFYIN